MSEHDQQHESGLKVTDRRHFTESGERRREVEAVEFEERAQAAAAPPLPAPPAAKPGLAPAPNKTPPPAPPERLAAREISFGGLLQDLYATAMLQLGAELQPGQPPQLDLEGARETVDLLGMLQQKTHGNLDQKEERLLSTILYELRMAYTEVHRAATARVQPAAAMPPPIPHRRR
ncbi:MAG: DUF1844 domain-containing protein [Terriglobales bacterium]